jgi:hypothetical protein
MSWEKQTNLYFTNLNHSLAKNDSYIYLSGGLNHESIVYRRKIDGLDWELFHDFDNDTDYRFRDHRSFIRGNKLYLLGGKSNGLTRNFMSLNLNNHNIQELNPMKEARDRFGCSVIDDYLYVVGGEDKDQSYIERYHFDSNSWDVMTALPDALGDTDSVIFNNIMWTVSENGSINTYDPSNDSWNEKETFNRTLENVTVSKIKQSLYFYYNTSSEGDHPYFARAINGSGIESKPFLDHLSDVSGPRGGRMISGADDQSIFFIGGVTDQPFTGDEQFHPESPTIAKSISVNFTGDDQGNTAEIQFEIPDQNDITGAEVRFDFENFESNRESTTFLKKIDGDITGKTHTVNVDLFDAGHYFFHIFTKTGAQKYSESLENQKNLATLHSPEEPIIKNIREYEEQDRKYQNREQITLRFESSMQLNTDKSFVNFSNIDSTAFRENIEEVGLSPNIYEVTHTIDPNNRVPNGEYLISIKAVPTV